MFAISSLFDGLFPFHPPMSSSPSPAVEGERITKFSSFHIEQPARRATEEQQRFSRKKAKKRRRKISEKSKRKRKTRGVNLNFSLFCSLCLHPTPSASLSSSSQVSTVKYFTYFASNERDTQSTESSSCADEQQRKEKIKAKWKFTN